MNPVTIITKKRNGEVLTAEEIHAFIGGYVAGEIPDYQVSAWLMACCFNPLTEEETFALTDAMISSGATFDLSAIPGKKVDKHSTGGVGDKTTLIVAPLAAACGVPVAKMSGRGLGITGGTLDKLESIPGFQTSLSTEAFINQVKEHGLAVCGQTEEVAKADKLLYALRDVTATVDEKGLIASSIMSKKLAMGTDAIVLDVKYGKGAFMTELKDATALAERMEAIGKAAGTTTIAVMTNMDQPLGQAVGNSVEVMEAIETLKGRGPKDITTLSVHLAAVMVLVGEKAQNAAEALRKVKIALDSGAGLSKFKEMVASQGGDPAIVDDPEVLPRPAYGADIVAQKAGWIKELDAHVIGEAAAAAGAGRVQKEDDIDPAAGIFLYHKIGEKVEAGQRLARVFGNDMEKIETAVGVAENAFVISEEAVAAPPLFDL